MYVHAAQLHTPRKQIVYTSLHQCEYHQHPPGPQYVHQAQLHTPRSNDGKTNAPGPAASVHHAACRFYREEHTDQGWSCTLRKVHRQVLMAHWRESKERSPIHTNILPFAQGCCAPPFPQRAIKYTTLTTPTSCQLHEAAAHLPLHKAIAQLS
jgi:hypothetical protein